MKWCKEFRVTPLDGVRVSEVEWDHACCQYGVDKMVVYEEGGDGTKKNLHYHGVFEGDISETKWRRMLRDLAHEGPPGPNGERPNGNALYFTREPHEKTFQYIAKYKKRVYLLGFTEAECVEWERDADEYRREREREKKQEQRERDEEMLFVYDETRKWFQEQLAVGRWTAGTGWSMTQDRWGKSVYSGESVQEAVVDFVLKLCDVHQIRFPVRTQMETIVLRIVYKAFPEIVRNHYVKVFSL